MSITIEDVLKSFRLHLTDKRKRLIVKAYEFAKAAHKGQKRKSGENYIVHPLGTAKILAELGMGSITVASALLHDVPEDTSITLKDIEKEFGSEISGIISGITKLGKVQLRGSREEYFLENLRKMFLAMVTDIRSIIVKLADRLDNMNSLGYLEKEKQQRIAQETMEIFVPIANRLGMGEVKGKLEDLAFKYIDPENFEMVRKLSADEYRERENYVRQAISELKAELKKEGIKAISISGRTKNLYRTFLKLKERDMNIKRIYDLAAIRILVPGIPDCYETLGVVHKKYHPMVGRIKDYISLPKPNGYQSLHTTVFGPGGKIMEIQIRTQKMHDEAEFGIAAHWIYSEKETAGWKKYFFKFHKSTPAINDLIWIRQLREWQNEIGHGDFEEFMRGLKIDFLKNHIFAFTPKGDIIDLPEEATPVDFAYLIHSEVGKRTIGARADGKIIPLDYQIKNGQVIEILTSKEKKYPSRDWLRFVKTSGARGHIKRELRKKEEKA